jgi:hypothetical protein
MKTLLVEIESEEKAKELSSMISSMNFVKRVSTIKKRKDIIAALEEHESVKAAIVKKKNKAIAKYL